MDNPYLPSDWDLMEVREIIPHHFFLTLAPSASVSFPAFRPGQFFQLSLPGMGEAPISISSPPTRPGTLEMCVRRVGRLTGAVSRLKRGDRVGLRGPLGNGYPLELIRGRDLVILAGGLGMVPLRSLMMHVADTPREYGNITVLYGARTEGELLFTDELLRFGGRRGVHVELIVQEITGDSGYRMRFGSRVGFVTDLIRGVDGNPAESFVAMCGPPAFYRYAVKELLTRGYSKGLIYLSLERRMECGIGKCGHCSVGYRYTCVEGPIFNYWDAFNTPEMVEMREGDPWINS